MNNGFKFSDLERAAFARITHENEARRIEAEMKRQERIEAGTKQIDAIVEANREERAEREQKTREQQFIAEAELAFFKANPAATESDFKRLLPKIKDEFLLGIFRDARRNDTPEFWNAEMQ